jgi:hypothetical protein
VPAACAGAATANGAATMPSPSAAIVASLRTEGRDFLVEDALNKGVLLSEGAVVGEVVCPATPGHPDQPTFSVRSDVSMVDPHTPAAPPCRHCFLLAGS